MSDGETQPAIDRAVEIIRAGGLVGFPTETVWGLAADARSDSAVKGLQEWKGRDPKQPISVLIASDTLRNSERLEELGFALDDRARNVCQTFLPGPLTVVLACAEDAFAGGIAGPTGGVGIRCSSHPLTDAFAAALERAEVGPVTATSLNHWSDPAARNRKEAEDYVSRREAGAPKLLISDDAPEAGGAESTVLDLSGAEPRVLRWGAVGPDAFEARLGWKLEVEVRHA